MYKNKRPYKPNYVPDSLKKIPKITPYTQKYIPTNDNPKAAICQGRG